jgi:hypothetical protein
MFFGFSNEQKPLSTVQKFKSAMNMQPAT